MVLFILSGGSPFGPVRHMRETSAWLPPQASAANTPEVTQLPPPMTIAKRFAVQLLPFALLFTATIGLDVKYGLSETGQGYAYSCVLSAGASAGMGGFQVVTPSHEQSSIFGSTANLMNNVMGCYTLN